MSIEKKEKMILEIRKNTRFGLIASILETCQEPTAKSEIFHASHMKLTYNIINQVAGKALKCKLLKKQNNRYVTTLKGKSFIRQFKQLLKLLEE